MLLPVRDPEPHYEYVPNPRPAPTPFWAYLLALQILKQRDARVAPPPRERLNTPYV